MSETTKISWCDSTFEPWIGCPRKRTSPENWQQPVRWNRQAQNTGTRRKVFCSSLADIFDTEVPLEWLRELLELIRTTPALDWLLLTKRPTRILTSLVGIRDAIVNRVGDGWDEFGALAAWISRWLGGDHPRNVWVGTSVEGECTIWRAQAINKVPAAVRFLSCEPMLGFIPTHPDGWECPYCSPEWPGDVVRIVPDSAPPRREHFPCPGMFAGIDWVICGGESGPAARPMHPAWVRRIRDICRAFKIPFFFKQWGEWIGGLQDMERTGKWEVESLGADRLHVWPDKEVSFRIGKHAAGDYLDGVQHHAFPEVSD